MATQGQVLSSQHPRDLAHG